MVFFISQVHLVRVTVDNGNNIAAVNSNKGVELHGIRRLFGLCVNNILDHFVLGNHDDYFESETGLNKVFFLIKNKINYGNLLLLLVTYRFILFGW